MEPNIFWSIVIFVFIVIVLFVALTGNSNLSTQIASFRSSISGTLSGYLSNSTNAIKKTLENGTSALLAQQKNFTNQMNNQLSNQKAVLVSNMSMIQNKVTALNATQQTDNSQIQSKLDVQTAQLNNINGIASSLLNLNNTISKNLATTINTINSIILLQNKSKVFLISNETSNIITGNYIFGAMLEGFANHLVFSSNGLMQLNILTAQQYANLATNTPYNSINVVSSNSINYWFNQSENCGDYVYTLSSAANNLIVTENITAKYIPKNGVC